MKNTNIMEIFSVKINVCIWQKAQCNIKGCIKNTSEKRFIFYDRRRCSNKSKTTKLKITIFVFYRDTFPMWKINLVRFHIKKNRYLQWRYSVPDPIFILKGVSLWRRNEVWFMLHKHFIFTKVSRNSLLKLKWVKIMSVRIVRQSIFLIK